MMLLKDLLGWLTGRGAVISRTVNGTESCAMLRAWMQCALVAIELIAAAIELM